MAVKGCVRFASACCFAGIAVGCGFGADAGFASPSPTERPGIWMHFIGGNVARPGIPLGSLTR